MDMINAQIVCLIIISSQILSVVDGYSQYIWLYVTNS